MLLLQTVCDRIRSALKILNPIAVEPIDTDILQDPVRLRVRIVARDFAGIRSEIRTQIADSLLFRWDQTLHSQFKWEFECLNDREYRLKQLQLRGSAQQ